MTQLEIDNLRKAFLNSAIFSYYEERGEGRANQANVAHFMMSNGQASRNGKKAMTNKKNWITSKVSYEEHLANAKLGSDALIFKLQNDSSFYEWFCKNQSQTLLKWNEENPIESKLRVEKALKGLQDWRKENPEKYAKDFAKFQTKGQQRSKELECWKIGWKVAHENYKLWQQTEDYQRWKQSKSDFMSNQRNDPNSQFNINMRKALSESEYKRKSELENIKRATETISRIVQCPHCEKAGAYRIMQRWHFDNCKNN